jgi:hypothetical protein
MSPFDKARYERSLKGLEISVLKMSEVASSDNPTIRIDAEFFRKEFLVFPRFSNPIGSFSEVKSGTTPTDRDDDYQEGVTLLKTVDIQNRPLSSADSHLFYKISREIAERMSKTRLCAGDVLINIVGATTDVVGRVALVPRGFPDANITQAMAFIRSTNSDFAPEVIFAFLSCWFGQAQVRRLARPTGQFNLNLREVESIRIPNFSAALTNAIRGRVQNSSLAREASCGLITKAGKQLLEPIGLTVWNPPSCLTYIRLFSEVQAHGRIDAEHYREEFYAATRRLKEVGAIRFVPMDELLTSLTNGHTPLRHNLDEGEVPFLCAEHVANFQISFDSDKRILLQHHQLELSRTALRNGDVLLTIKGRVGNAALADRVAGPVNINQDVALLRLNNRLPIWYVLSFINSPFGQLQVKQLSTGAINPFLGLANVRRLEIPEFAPDLMQRIANETKRLVESARETKTRAYDLLAQAKRAVEIAIEDSEAAALKYLKES